jgi:hypothetical protein
MSEYATNLDGLHAMHEAIRNRKRQRTLGLCCRGGDLCETCEIEAEAKYADD